MKTSCILYLFLDLFLISCSFKNELSENDIIKINLIDGFQEKEIQLNDIADIEYVSMEESDEYVFEGSPQYITNNAIVFYNMSDGSILFFSKDGKPKSKFNHKGNGPMEYTFCSRIIYNEKHDELFVKTEKKILVYSSSGDYKRTISLPSEASVLDVLDYDDLSLLLYDANGIYPSCFVLVSKENGDLIDEIKLPHGDDIKLSIVRQEKDMVSMISGLRNNIVRYKDGFLLTDYTTDTVFFYNKKKEITPVLVRTPDIQTMDPVVYVNSFVESGDYQFFRMTTVKNVQNRLPKKFLVRDKHHSILYEQKIVFNDFRGKLFQIAPETISKNEDSSCGYIELNLEELKSAFSEGFLSGELKEIMKTKSLIDDGNNIYMMLSFK